jgi:hypothetical protein
MTICLSFKALETDLPGKAAPFRTQLQFGTLQKPDEMYTAEMFYFISTLLT